MSEGEKKKPVILWTRTQVAERVDVSLAKDSGNWVSLPGNARGEWLVREDDGAWVVSVFLRNTNPVSHGPDDPEECLYQPEIIVRGSNRATVILNRAHRFNQAVYDPDMESYRLLYRDKPEFVVGHGCATGWDNSDCPPDRARMVCTELLPAYLVTATEAKGGVGLAGLDMESLATAESGADVFAALNPLLSQYGDWIAERRAEIADLPVALRAKASEHLDDCEEALARMKAGLQLVASDKLTLEAFQFANRAMVLQRRKSIEAANYQKGKGRGFEGPPPAWRPFQIAFILLNLRGIV